MPYYTALSRAARQNATNAVRNCGALFSLLCAKNPVRHLGRVSSAFMQKLVRFHTAGKKMWYSGNTLQINIL